jgi:cell division protein FtsQ
VRGAAKIVHGTPLVRVDTAAVTRRVERLPDVASAQVSTSFPTTVTIVVVERRPVAYLPTAGGATLVDRTGARYRTVAVAPAGLPRLAGTASRSTAAALAAVAAALPADVRAQVRSIQALDPNSITLLLDGGRLVRWGSSARSADKARVLPVLLRGQDDQIDVTDPDQPYTH